MERIQLPVTGMLEMQAEANREGYHFLNTLLSEWMSGTNRFDAPGEGLCGVFESEMLVAVGGLNCDPFLQDRTVGRIRRLYVRRPWRNRGVGSALLDMLVNLARGHFVSVRLRTDNADASRLYVRKGFTSIASDTATHVLHL